MAADQPPSKIRCGQIKWKRLRDEKKQRALIKLQHACECSDSNCTNSDCDEMKSTVIHFNQCNIKPKKNCRICKQLLALSLYHAKRFKDCESDKCLIPYCAKLKHMLMLKKKANRKTVKDLKELYREDFDVCEKPSTSTNVETIAVDDEDDDVVPVTNQQQPRGDDVTNNCPTIDEIQPTIVVNWSQTHSSEVARPMVPIQTADTSTTVFVAVDPQVTPATVPPNTSSAQDLTSGVARPNERYWKIPALHPAVLDTFFSTTEEAANQLKSLLHAHRCLTGEMTGAVGGWPCFEPNCTLWKNVLQHVDECTTADDNNYCTFLHCFTSKILLKHWKTCFQGSCQLCLSIRRSASIMQGLTLQKNCPSVISH